ncbi:MAG: hypothetical protein N4A57_04735 [Anaeromicrobium sp.]|jgi:hypothetical protein|uniref:hypothetical protein n=1 Tax=Anaeromicrobium sp. TaxID=1929132 RepID=UPI0025F55E38|nr:hypothetical protein [Anaeromicrobium sp.]MCT4593563.1 hypothetical protein [Anaeromicrobium sp.]
MKKKLVKLSEDAELIKYSVPQTELTITISKKDNKLRCTNALTRKRYDKLYYLYNNEVLIDRDFTYCRIIDYKNNVDFKEDIDIKREVITEQLEFL